MSVSKLAHTDEGKVMSNVKQASTYVTPADLANDEFDQYQDALARIYVARQDLRYAKSKLVKRAIDAGAIDALSVNVGLLRRMLGR